ncbi:SDR family oxidoreductase [Alicyclobacillus sp. SO9]|uniref:SDR family oxidoreductase n=1 Tax=Alicyclobacillus sp. SO9 TaxID=2665646 RepID=UPI0018E75867|nr:SDR family oxidoreductase [Alicyclobacillus sp. SO9]QQE79218.1 SDR family NAD(P)-dependent oxidoreductase [Alicyclobacillus sp. SO9]
MTALKGKIALVAGATRGAGRAIAVELARAGAFVYVTGRSSSATGPSEIGRPETIEETEALLHAAGGQGKSIRVNHVDPDQVESLLQTIQEEQGRLDILVNDMFGGDRYAEWNKPLWEHNLEGGLRMLRMGVDTHLITLSKAIPLMLRTTNGIIIEMTDGTEEYNSNFRQNVGAYYDLVKASVGRIIKALTFELANEPMTALGVTPGWLRSEMMLENFGVTEQNWRDACISTPDFGISESPTYVARGIAALVADSHVARFAGRTLTSKQLADLYDVTDVDGSRPDCWGMLEQYGDIDESHIEAFR